MFVQDFEDYVECFEYGPLFALGTTCSPQTLLELFARSTTGNPGSVIVPQYGSSKITVFVWGKNIILKFLGNTK